MKTIILAAGFSTRLYPITLNFPKALLKVHEIPIIEPLLNQAIDLHDNEITLTTNQRYFQHFHDYIDEHHFPIRILNNGVSKKDRRLGAIGDLLFTLEQNQWEDNLLVLPSDTLVSLDLEKFVQFAKEKNEFCTVVYDLKNTEEIREKLGCAVLENDKIVKFVEKPEEPPSTLASVPIYFYPKHTLQFIEEYKQTGGNLDSPGAIIPWLLEKTPCFAYEIKDGYYHDVGTKEMLERLNSEL